MNLWLSGGAAAILAISCMDTSAQQCRSASDCATILGVPEWKAYCSEGVCGASQIIENDAAPPAPCQTSQECTTNNGGVPHVCRADQCVRIVDGEVITEVTTNYAHGDPIFIGFIAPITDSTGFQSQHSKTWIDTVKYAALDWETGSENGILVPGTQKRRPIVAVFCDSQDNPTRVESCVDKMIKLGTPAIVVRSSWDADAALPKTLASKTLLYCSDCEASDLDDDTPTQGLRWLGAPPLENQTPIRVAWGKEVEKLARVDHQIPSAPIRVAYVSSAEIPYNSTLAQQFEFGGEVKSYTVQYGQTDWRALAEEIVDYKPHVIVTSEIGYDFHLFMLPEVEARWNTGKPPRYILSESESYDLPLQRTIGSNSNLRRRITGVWISASDQVLANWRSFEDAFEASTTIGGYRPGGNVSGFESFYSVAFAVTAALGSPTTTEPMTGTDVANGLKRLMGGAPANVIDYKIDQIARGIRILLLGESIDARGVYSELEWDPATGKLRSDAGIWCPSFENGQTSTKEMWHYDARAQALVGQPNPNACQY